MTPAVSADTRASIFVLNFTARGAPAEATVEGVLDFYDAARKHIVCGFVALTTSEMHKKWGMKT